MSGLEILGVAASAVQLAQLSLAIVTTWSSLFLQLRDIPNTVQNRILQVKTLGDIARLIGSKSHLQTEELKVVLDRCLKAAGALRDVLQGLFVEGDGPAVKRWAKSVGGLVMERKVLELMQNLEREKTALVLSIASIDSSLLYEINIQLQAMDKNLENVAQGATTELRVIRAAMERLTIQFRDQQRVPLSVEERTAACLASLSPMDQTSFRAQILNRSKNSCVWIQETEKYLIWDKSSYSGLFRITARAGCGKTTLAAHVSEWGLPASQTFETTVQVANSPDHTQKNQILLFFFFQRSSQEAESTGIAALRTLIHQLIKQDASVIPIISSQYESLSARGTLEWSWESLSIIFEEMLQAISVASKIYIILDAVDECEAESRKSLLDYLRRVLEDQSTSSPSLHPKPIVKVLITSRPDADVFDCLSDFPCLEIKNSDTVHDISALIRKRVQDFAHRRRLGIGVSDSIIRFLEGNAHGMFLWVVLILEELCRRDERLTDEAISTKLSIVPLTLVTTYEAILQKPSTSRKSDMWRIFRWLLFGRRGLTLEELETALCLETGVTQWHDFAGDVDFLCGSLLRIDGTRGEINLLHKTTRDFLENFVKRVNSALLGEIEMESTAAHAHLAEICVRYLFLDQAFSELEELLLSTNILSEYQHTVADFLRRYPFLCYAIESWASHLQAASAPSRQLAELTQQLLASRRHRAGIMRLIYYINYLGNPFAPTETTPIHLAAYFNLPWLVDIYISQSENRAVVHAVNQSEDTPLIWTSEMGSTDCVKRLLDAGADPNKVEWDGWSALHWAARNGHKDVAELLIEHGASLDQKDSKGLTAMDWAAGREHWAILDILEEHADTEELAKLQKIMREQYSMRGHVVIRESRSGDGTRHSYGARTPSLPVH